MTPQPTFFWVVSVWALIASPLPLARLLRRA